MQFENNIPSEKENRWAAFLNGESDVSETSNPEIEEIADFTSVWKATGDHFSYSSANTDRAWLTLHSKIVKPKSGWLIKMKQSRMLKYAAMIVMVIATGFATYQALRIPEKKLAVNKKMNFIETVAHPVILSVLTLPDGSTVKMNASTKIEYPEQFAADIRKVKMSGEAFFEVVKDPAHPFIIETENASIEVLGTSFNVSAYPHAGLVDVNVETGKVKLTLTQAPDGKSIPKSTILTAGSRGWLKVVNEEIGQEETLAPNYSSWITKKISFQRTPLAEAFSVLGNTYHVKVLMAQPEIGQIPYTANFADLKLDYIIEVIARTHHLEVKRNGDEIIFDTIPK